jgi:dsDNA-binding SOS-regulon protein
MSIGTQIHDKLITDFATLTFGDGNITFNNVKKFYRAESQQALDCLVLPDTTPEVIVGQSAGNTQTTRQYTYRIIVTESIEEATTDEEGANKYSRILDIQDGLLDYLQKEPSNLNAWGQTNNIHIFKIRVNNPRFDRLSTANGYAEVLDLTFTVFVNVIPQNL